MASVFAHIPWIRLIVDGFLRFSMRLNDLFNLTLIESKSKNILVFFFILSLGDLGFFSPGFFRNLSSAHQIYMPFGDKIIVLK